MTQELDIIKTLWPIGLAFAALIVWGIRQEQAIRQDRAARIAADNRIDQSVRTAHEQNNEQMVGVKEAIESMAKEQSETVKNLHKVELTLTEIAAYEKGRTDERAKRGHDD